MIVWSEAAFSIEGKYMIWSRKVRKVAKCRTSGFNWERSKMIADFDCIDHFCCKLRIIQG